VERIDASASGRVEVVGRWFGVRGRRFVRPALTLGRRDGEVRALADLDHKPWAAQDGEVWRAAFSVDSKLDEAKEIELTVAPDIVVALRTKGRKLAAPGATLAAAQAARPSRGARGGRASGDAPGEATGDAAAGGQASAEPRRRPSPSAELERLGARLATANEALEQERERRAALAKTLEEERTASRMLRTELGQARSELEIAAAARAEAAEAEAELEVARQELREARRRHEEVVRRHEEATQALTGRHEEATQALTGRHDELAQAHAALQQELQEQAAALEAGREALGEERAESGRLRNRLAQVQEARQQRGAAAPAPPPARAAEPRPAAAAADPEPRTVRRASSRTTAQQRPADPRPAEPLATQPYDVELITQGLDTRAAAAPSASRRERHRSAHTDADPHAWDAPTSERLRPINPSLRHRTYWFGRLLALLVLLGVIAAVWLVLHSTVLH
jgi:hypothetical protein